MADVPTIDIAPARDGPSGLARVARDVGLAARDIGFFSVAGHGVPQGLVAEMFAAAHSFFALPASAKAELAIEKSPQYLGYARMAFEKLDPSRPGDAKESFNMGSERAADDPDLLAGKPFVGRNQWPESRAFRATMLQYFEALLAVGLTVHRAIATDLGLPADYFAHAYERSLSALRVLRYPPHPGTFDGKQFGAGPHTDYGGVTLLAQDDVAGLEVRRCDDALDERRLRFERPPRRQPLGSRTLFRSVFLRTESRRRHRVPAGLRRARSAREISADRFLRLSTLEARADVRLTGSS
jgi:isopenicillin N synthase-like dioxygenase